MTVPAAPADALTELRELARSGQLATRYPRVRELVAGLPEADLGRAGQLLARLDADEVRRSYPATPALTVTVTGHGTLSLLVPALAGELTRHGIAPRITVGTFDSYVFDLADPASALYAAQPDLVLLVLDPMVVFDEVPTPWTAADVTAVLAEKVSLVSRLAAQFAAHGSGTLVLNTVPLPSWYPAQLVDYASRAQLGIAWREANAELLRLAQRYPSVLVFDLDPLTAEGVPVSDARLSIYTKTHLSPALLARYARELGHLARNLTGKTSKTLVVDLDNTVWGGILGDDGIAGIEVAETYKGEAFRTFQKVLRQLGSQGVLLAAVSKNELELVREALRDKPGMTLREEDFVAVVANWRPKSDNLRELARGLGLGLDSFVFVDDSPFECGEVRHALPEVSVVPVGEDPAGHTGRLLRDTWFAVRQTTAEDRARSARYRDELDRRAFLDRFESTEDYLRALGVTVDVRLAGEADLPRVSQMTLRTNQFNLTTRRLQPAQLHALHAEPDHKVVAVRSGDRFGDNGLVGAVFLRRAGDLLHIDNFVLSCRVFGRGIEQACLAVLLQHARRTNATAVHAEYRPTARNIMVRDLYPRYGFAELCGDDTAITFRHDLRDAVVPPEHIELSDGLAEEGVRR